MKFGVKVTAIYICLIKLNENVEIITFGFTKNWDRTDGN